MVRAIIFDCFGVLTYDGWLPFKRQHFSDDQALDQEATDLSRQVNAGLLDYKDFIQEIADLADASVAETAKAIHDNVPNEELFTYIRDKLKPRYKIGLLSNAGRNMLEDIFSPEHLQVFDAIGLSYEMGSLKPDRRAYQIIAERLGIEPEEGVLIDDVERHCGGARDSGMPAILYEDFEQMKRELEPLLLSDTKN